MRAVAAGAPAGALAFVLLALALASSAVAATRDFHFTRLGAERGLGQNSITTMLQDPQGFVWVGTQGGLHRYDGQRYVPYRHDPRDPGSLPDSFITALALDGETALWVGSYSQFVSRLDLRSGKIQRFPSGARSDQPSRQVMALLAKDRHVWIGTLAGLERFDPASGRRERVLELDPEDMRQSTAQHLLADRSGNLWYANATGLFLVDPQGQVRQIGPPAITRSLTLDRDGRLWVGRQDGLHRLDANGRTLTRLWPAAGAEGQSDVLAVVETPDRQLWLSIKDDGLRRFTPATGAVVALRQESGITASLPENTITALLIDLGGMLWTGGQHRGVSVTDPRGTRFRYVFQPDSDQAPHTVPDESVRAVHQGSDRALWFATDDARLLRHDPATDRVDDRTAQLGFPPGSAPRVTAIADAGNGRLWLATSRGLLRLPTGTGAPETIELGVHTGVDLRSMLVDREGDLWLGTSRRGALHYQRKQRRVVHYSHASNDPRRLSHPAVHALLEDRQGRIWLGTGDGLDLLDPSNGRLRHLRSSPATQHSLPGSLVRALHQSSNGTIWVGTHAGLSRVVEGDDGHVTFVHPLASALDGHVIPTIFSIAQSRQAAGPSPLWLGTSHGIVRFDVIESKARFYGLADGLQDLEFNGGAAAQLANGQIAMGGVRGLNVFDPAAMQDSTYVPPLRLLGVRVGANAPSDVGAPWLPQQLSMPDYADILRLRIGALDYAPAAEISYRYLMEGFDQGWVDNGPQPDITYTRLPPGEYMFRAQATNRDGIWSSQELRIPVRVAPPMWRHPMSIAAVALCLLALLAILGRQWQQRRTRERGYFRQIREREERLQLALWASGEQFWDFDPVRRALNRMRADGGDSDTPDARVLTEFDADHDIHPEDLPRVEAAMREHMLGDAVLFEAELRTRSGDNWRWMRARGRVVERDPDGRPLRVSGTARDITSNRDAERERRVSSEVLRSMAEAVAVFDGEFLFVSINPAFTRMTGYQDIEVIGRSTSLLDSLQHETGFYEQMRDELQRHGRWSGEIWQQRRDGNEFLCWLQASAVTDGDDERSHFVAVLSDITDQKRAEQELRYLAKYDTLTSLPNRTLLSERLSRAIVRARRNNRKIAVLFLDLDRFKDINDSLGHAAGDRILRAAANRLQETVGAQHTVARLGGDEFTVVLEDLGSGDDAEVVARRLIAAFEQPLDFDDRHEVTISPSIGISLYPDHAQVPTDLLKHADTAMYQAKAAGRRTFMRYTDAMDIEIRRRATISAALRKVLDRGELRLVFQPRLSLPTGRITGVEALLRWQSAEYGNIPPMQFIPLAEENGLILEIGEWALQEACSTLAGWRRHGLDAISMAVNVSSLQLLRGDLPELVARVLVDSGIPADRLELELTESVIMENADQTSATLQALRTLGISLAIDDFGTGYSSLAYLKRLPITTLKIDKEFIDDLTLDPDDEAITSTIIAMAHSLGLNVVAEGVETEAQMHFLQNHRCDEIQGYWLARPLEGDHCLSFLQKWTPERAAQTLAEPSAALMARPVLTGP